MTERAKKGGRVMPPKGRLMRKRVLSQDLTEPKDR